MSCQQIPKDVVWALKEAGMPGGFMPNAESTALFLGFLQTRGLVQRADALPVWNITDAGRSVLSGDAGLTKDDLAALATFERALA